MYTSEHNRTLNHAKGYAFASAFCALFGAIYEHFSHQVYSYYMIYAFAIPLLLGLLPLLLIGTGDRPQPGRFFLNVYNAGIAALTLGCLFKGVLDIYGTTNRKIIVYPILSALLILIACFGRGYFSHTVKTKSKNLSD